tara:strand:- start:10290 stop:11228 length:939 start_codon:yes stop_codon:yes gene_type:complete
MIDRNSSIITIIGPTSSGKTSMGVGLAKLINGEIIGLDSRQVYKGMKVGTAQPTKKEKDNVIHHLLGFRNPWEPISAGSYAELVQLKVSEINKKKKIPIICGGAGLYLRALNNGIFLNSVTDLDIRERLESEYDKDASSLLVRLSLIDPDYAEIVHINNKKRLVRALEIYESTGKSPSDHFSRQIQKPSKILNLFIILLTWKRETLIERIIQRTDKMFEDGWIEEVEDLLKRQSQVEKTFTSLNSIGYQQISSFLKGQIKFEEMREDIIVKTRQFARRQMQWFKKEKIDIFVESDNLDTEKLPQILHCILRP